MHRIKAVIGFEGYRIHCIIGVNPPERELPQDMIVDLKVFADCTASLENDSITHTIDYTMLSELCKEVAIKGKFGLLEAYANEVLDTIFRQYQAPQYQVDWAWISVKKPGAIPGADAAFVEMKREGG